MNRPIRTTLAVAGLTLLAAAAVGCGGSGSDGQSGQTPSADAVAVGDATPAASSGAETPDACTVLDIVDLRELSGLPLSEPREDGSGPWESACTFWYEAPGGTNVNVVLSAGWDGYPVTPPLSTVQGFEEIYGPASPVDDLGMPGWSAFDGSSVTPQASVVATDGSRYVLVAFTGDTVTVADTPSIARVAAAYVEAM